MTSCNSQNCRNSGESERSAASMKRLNPRMSRNATAHRVNLISSITHDPGDTARCLLFVVVITTLTPAPLNRRPSREACAHSAHRDPRAGLGLHRVEKLRRKPHVQGCGLRLDLERHRFEPGEVVLSQIRGRDEPLRRGITPKGRHLLETTSFHRRGDDATSPPL